LPRDKGEVMTPALVLQDYSELWMLRKRSGKIYTEIVTRSPSIDKSSFKKRSAVLLYQDAFCSLSPEASADTAWVRIFSCPGEKNA
jgi:hypothetical protein